MAGGARRGAFYDPTVLVSVPEDSPAFADENFGPVAPVAHFTDPLDAVRMANFSSYGFQAAVFTRGIQRAFTLAGRLDVGGVVTNGSTALRAENLSFGGPKDTGGSSEGLHDTALEFTRPRTCTKAARA
ncbi:aldehyde dehydrogenase family protein [Streptomyces sp. NBC_01511]|uniref:aldehyde dehydrogenase family protein n=1 Tax=Streptomyces sp. NBC_01511 TaxID=2903889 RepID=UPI0038692F4C